MNNLVKMILEFTKGNIYVEKNNKSNKRIASYKNGKLVKKYKNTMAAAQALNCQTSCLNAAASGNTKSSHGLVWKYI